MMDQSYLCKAARCVAAALCLLAATACDDDIPSDERFYGDYLDLTVWGGGPANCYVVDTPGLYAFRAEAPGEGPAEQGTRLSPPPPRYAKLLWETERGLVTDVSMSADGMVLFNHPQNRFGNALVAVVDGDDTVLWSWHIWMPAEPLQSIPSAQGYELMHLNLGAINSIPGDVGSYGMFYQWGRKDPFPAAATLTGDISTTHAPLTGEAGAAVAVTTVPVSTGGTVGYAVAHPTVYISGETDWLVEPSDDLWGNPQGDYRDEGNAYPNKGVKSVYDPCPAGWRVPPADVFRNFTSSGGYAWILEDFALADRNGDGGITPDDWLYGWLFRCDAEHAAYFPASGRWYGAYGMLYGSVAGLWGNYWGNCPNEAAAFCVLAFQNTSEMTTVSPAASASRADGFAVRCIRE